MALADSADSLGAKFWKHRPSAGENWGNEFNSSVAYGRTKTHFNLDGIDDPVAAARLGDGLDPIFDGQATAWELTGNRNNPGSWPNVLFYRDGVPVANPFIP
ncbi:MULTISPECIES: hypothetical protein [Amycolatopsis]|uniref:Uncharacterized protein n=1 Tax=Amycolatopsis dendrobii TaxID=2760662 RepID=A0A7W3W6T3_9PSEU|nr:MULTISPECIES: hypothetical protein [Amycolatopsis]MBB1159861.1 hypothetical protein [Amycolatopsis dendrobii]UKD59088.1 hypothetical protein L3Q65_20960 [Amycolatopsis sp. FU40]